MLNSHQGDSYRDIILIVSSWVIVIQEERSCMSCTSKNKKTKKKREDRKKGREIHSLENMDVRFLQCRRVLRLCQRLDRRAITIARILFQERIVPAFFIHER